MLAFIKAQTNYTTLVGRSTPRLESAVYATSDSAYVW